MARNLNNPETPKEGVEETKRDLDNLRSEVEEWEQSAENESTSVDSTEQLENDAEVKSGFEKILNKSFEKTISDFEKELPNDFTIDGYMKTIAESHKDLWSFIAWELWLPAGAFFWAWWESGIKFSSLELGKKINFIAFKKAIDKLTTWKKNLDKISSENIINEVYEQNELLMKKSDEYYTWKALNELAWLAGLTPNEERKITNLLEKKWVTIEVPIDPEWDKHKHWPEPISGTILLIARWITVIWWAVGWYYLAKNKYDKKPSTTNTPRENYQTTIEYPENIMRYMTHQAHAIADVHHAEQKWPGDTMLQRLGNKFWTDTVHMNVSGDVTTSFEWKSKATFNKTTGVLTVNVDRPTIFARNVEGVILDQWWSLIKLFKNDQIQMHGIKLWEYAMLQEYRWYKFNEVTKKWEKDPVLVKSFEKNLVKSLEEWLKQNITFFWITRVNKVVVNLNPWSETKIELESPHRTDNPDVKPWLRAWDRPWAEAPHYK